MPSRAGAQTPLTSLGEQVAEHFCSAARKHGWYRWWRRAEIRSRDFENLRRSAAARALGRARRPAGICRSPTPVG